MQIDPKEAFQIAIRLVGGKKALGGLVGVSGQTIANHFERTGQVRAEWIQPIVKACHGLVTSRQLRPDLYPPIEDRRKSAA